MWKWRSQEDLYNGEYRILQRFDEAFMLYALVLSRKPQNILEIGVRHGGSTRLMAQALFELNQVGVFRDGTIDAVDGTEKVDFVVPDHLKKYINLIRKNSPGGIPDKVYDLIHIDGDHSTDGVLRDLESVVARNYKSTLIVCHDVNHHFTRKGIEIFEDRHPEFHVIYDWTYRANDLKRPGGQQALLLRK